MDIRQIVMVSELLDPIVQDLSNLFEFEVAFNDPGVSYFGLENAVIPIGTDFLEVVSPVEENTTAGRFIKKRNGDGGYMVIIQVDDFDLSKSLVKEHGIGVVWETDLPEAKAIHLHPKESGKWAGPDWKNHISGHVKAIDGVEIQSSDPEDMFKSWYKVLGNVSTDSESRSILLDNTWLRFVEDLDGRGAGVSAFSIKVDEPKAIIDKARNLGFIYDGEIIIGGVKFYLA